MWRKLVFILFNVHLKKVKSVLVTLINILLKKMKNATFIDFINFKILLVLSAV